MYGILNDLILIWLRNFRVPDPDATGTFPFYLSIFEIIYKKKKLKIGQKEESTNYGYRYLPFSISHCSPTVQYYSPESSGLEIINKNFIELLFHSCLIQIRNK